MKAEIGDWVRFYRGGVLVIGVVNYISKDILNKGEYLTDAGSVGEESLQEVRKK